MRHIPPKYRRTLTSFVRVDGRPPTYRVRWVSVSLRMPPTPPLSSRSPACRSRPKQSFDVCNRASNSASGVRWKKEQSAPRWQSPRAKCRHMYAVELFCGWSARVSPLSVARQHRVVICRASAMSTTPHRIAVAAAFAKGRQQWYLDTGAVPVALESVVPDIIHPRPPCLALADLRALPFLHLLSRWPRAADLHNIIL
jgi:hypothetical protein